MKMIDVLLKGIDRTRWCFRFVNSSFTSRIESLMFGLCLIHFSLDGKIFCQQNQLRLQMKIFSLTLSFLYLFLSAETWYQTRLSPADQLMFQYRNLHRVYWGFQVLRVVQTFSFTTTFYLFVADYRNKCLDHESYHHLWCQCFFFHKMSLYTTFYWFQSIQ